MSDKFRYYLSRQFEQGNGTIVFIMLNPSTATQSTDDPTIRRCMGFAKRDFFRQLVVVNLFAYKATKPSDLQRKGNFAVGPGNDEFIEKSIEACDRVVCAWGSSFSDHPAIAERISRVKALVKPVGRPVHCLGLTKSGAPRHPLMVKANTPFQVYTFGE